MVDKYIAEWFEQQRAVVLYKAKCFKDHLKHGEMGPLNRWGIPRFIECGNLVESVGPKILTCRLCAVLNHEVSLVDCRECGKYAPVGLLLGDLLDENIDIVLKK